MQFCGFRRQIRLSELICHRIDVSKINVVQDIADGKVRIAEFTVDECSWTNCESECKEFRVVCDDRMIGGDESLHWHYLVEIEEIGLKEMIKKRKIEIVREFPDFIIGWKNPGISLEQIEFPVTRLQNLHKRSMGGFVIFAKFKCSVKAVKDLSIEVCMRAIVHNRFDSDKFKESIVKCTRSNSTKDQWLSTVDFRIQDQENYCLVHLLVDLDEEGFPIVGPLGLALSNSSAKGNFIYMKSIRLRNSNGFDFEIEQSEPEKFESLRNREERFWNAKQLKEENGIEGFKEFMGHQFIDSPDVLTPKESSAILVKSCISKLAEVSKMNQPDYHLRILDLGTGSGCLLIASILEFQKLCPHSKISGVGIDISESALEIAKRNANHLEVESFVQFFKCSFKDISCHFFVKMGLDYCKFDLIISNPPYFPSSYDSSRSSMKIKHQNDPSLALFAGPTGMEFYEEILKYSIEILHEHGYLILETGSRIHASLISFISKAETKFQIVEISSDAQGIPRSICLNRKPGKCNSS